MFRREVPAVALAGLAALLAACGGGVTASSGSSATATAGHTSPSPTLRGPRDLLCYFRVEPPAVYQHVIWFWFENTDEQEIQDDGGVVYPYTGSLLDRCGLATAYHNITHPSLPNYIAATSGSVQGAAIATDCGPSQCPQTQRSLFDQVQAAGAQWREYVETPSGSCTANPDAFYPSIATQCAQWEVPLGLTTGGALNSDLGDGMLPAFAFVLPDGNHDMGSGADGFLRDWVTQIAASPAYQSGSTAIFITWDEGGTARLPGETCDDRAHADVTAYPGCQVATIVVAPTVGAIRVQTDFTHYSLLRTTEELLGISQHLGAAAQAPSMRAAFHL